MILFDAPRASRWLRTRAAFFISRALFEISTLVGIVLCEPPPLLSRHCVRCRFAIFENSESNRASRATKIFEYSSPSDLSLLLCLGKNLIIHISGAYSKCHCPRLTARPRVLTPACTRCHLSAKTGAHWSERRDRFLSWFPSLFPASREEKRAHRLASCLPKANGLFRENALRRF